MQKPSPSSPPMALPTLSVSNADNEDDQNVPRIPILSLTIPSADKPYYCILALNDALEPLQVNNSDDIQTTTRALLIIFYSIHLMIYLKSPYAEDTLTDLTPKRLLTVLDIEIPRLREAWHGLMAACQEMIPVTLGTTASPEVLKAFKVLNLIGDLVDDIMPIVEANMSKRTLRTRLNSARLRLKDIGVKPDEIEISGDDVVLTDLKRRWEALKW
jgi:hypothetical protein